MESMEKPSFEEDLEALTALTAVATDVGCRTDMVSAARVIAASGPWHPADCWSYLGVLYVRHRSFDVNFLPPGEDNSYLTRFFAETKIEICTQNYFGFDLYI